MSRHPALVVDGEGASREAARDAMSDAGVDARFVTRVDEALFLLADAPFSVVVLGPRGSGAGAETFLAQALRARPEAVPLVIGATEAADALLDAGAFEVVPRGASRERLLHAVGRALRQHDQLSELNRLRAALGAIRPVPSLVGRSETMAIFREKLEAAAGTEVPVLLVGERGSGRSLSARLIHALSARSRGPFVRHDLASGEFASGPSALGAQLEQARGGVLLLAAGAESTALLTSRSDWFNAVRPGSAEVRWIVSVTRTPGATELESGGPTVPSAVPPFEVIGVPPLRERGRDTLVLVRHFIDSIRRRNQLPPVRISPEAIYLLECHDWPGNIKELREVVEQAMTLATGGAILASHIPESVRRTSGRTDPSNPAARARRFRESKKKLVDAFERSYLEDLLAWHRGNVTIAAEQAGMLRSALQRLLRKHELRSDAFRRGAGSKLNADA